MFSYGDIYYEMSLIQVLHRAERLRDMDVNVLPALLSLQQLVSEIFYISSSL